MSSFLCLGTCCLGDLTLAVRDDSNFLEEVKGKPLGHTSYLSPEVLEGCVSKEPLSLEVLKKADVYALGLVMWEIARRCYIQGQQALATHNATCKRYCTT